jgi:2-keto-3-deoxy-L-fuconate dehydrogenase
VAVVTGAGSGIGRAIAQRFAREGAVVHVVDLDKKAAAATVKEIEKSDGKATPHACDVSKQKSVEQLFQSLRKNGAFQVNVKGIYNCMYAAIGDMKASGGGVILNMASIAGSAGLADRFAYSMSKGAVIAMTYSVAKDYLAHKIRCNCISPARVHTPFVDDYLKKNYPGREEEMFGNLSASQPIGRMAEPKEVAALALFLCSDEASFVTGADYPLDGGFFNLRG